MSVLKNFFAKIKASCTSDISLRKASFLFVFAVAGIAAFIRTVNPQMKIFNHRAIGNAVMNGVDANVFISSFWICFAIFMLTFFVGNAVLNFIHRKILSRHKNFEVDISTIWLFTLLMFINMIIFMYDLFATKEVQAIPYIFFITYVIVFLNSCLNVIFPKFFNIDDTENNYQLQNLIVMLAPLPLAYFVLLLFPYQTNVMREGVIIYFALYLLAKIFVHGIKKIFLVIKALVPLSFLPLTYVVANEMQYTLSRHGIIFQPKIIALCLSAILICISIFYTRSGQDDNEFKNLKRLENIIFPVLLVTAGVFMTHQQIVEPSFDFLHSGNQLVPAQQAYQFGSIHLLDYWAPQHWPIGAYLYALINGYNFWEVTIWNPIFDTVINILVCYFVLRKFTGSKLAALLLSFTPMLSYCDPYYSIALLPFVYYDTLRENKRVRDFAMMSFLALTSFVFMSSAGKIAVLTSLIVCIFSCSSKRDFIKMLTGFFGVIIICCAIYFGCVLLRGERTIIDTIKLIQAMSICDNEIGTYWTLAVKADTPFEIFTCYGLLPMTAFLILIFTFRIKDKNSRHYALIFLTIAFIVAYLRVFGRHSLAEGFQKLFFPFLICVTPFALIKNKIHQKFSMFVIIFAIIFLPYVSYTRYPHSIYESTPNFNGDYGILSSGVKNFEFKTWKQNDIRCNTINKIEYPKNLRLVLDSVLNKNQTFFEAINSHLLYALMERKSPFLHHSVQIIFQEPAQEAYVNEFEKKYNAGEIPIVIFSYKDIKNSGIERKILANLDNIPGELSLFKLSEFIYTHYEPFLIVDGFELWKAKNSNINYKIPDGENNYITEFKDVEQNFDMCLLPFIWANCDKKIKNNFPAELEDVKISQHELNSTPISFDINKDIDKSSGNYIYLKITADASGATSNEYLEYFKKFRTFSNHRALTNGVNILTIKYGDEIQNTCSFVVLPGTNEYLVRISSQYNWINEPQNKISVSSLTPLTLEKLSILKGD